MKCNLGSTAGLLIAGLLGATLAGCGGGLGDLGTGAMRASPQQAYLAARQTLYRASASRDGAVRSRAVEALALTEGALAGQTLTKALDDEAVAVRFAAAMGVGDCRLTDAKGKLREMSASPETDPSVRCAIIYALSRMGDDSHINQLGGFLGTGSPEVRANAALAMAKIGQEAAIQPLREQLRDERHPGVKLQLLESLAALRDPRSFAQLSANARAGEPYARLQAVQALGRSRSPRAKRSLLRHMRPGEPPPLRIAAAGALARLGDRRGWSLAVRAVRDPQAVARESFDRNVAVSRPQQVQIQTLGALALGQMNRTKAVDWLLPLLKGPDETTRVAAAKSIMGILAEHRPSAPPAVPEPEPQVPTTRPAATGPAVRTAPPKE